MSFSPETVHHQPAPYIVVGLSTIPTITELMSQDPRGETAKFDFVFNVGFAALKVASLKQRHIMQTAPLKHETPDIETVNVYLIDVLPFIPVESDVTFSGLIGRLNASATLPQSSHDVLSPTEAACWAAFNEISEMTSAIPATNGKYPRYH